MKEEDETLKYSKPITCLDDPDYMSKLLDPKQISLIREKHDKSETYIYLDRMEIYRDQKIAEMQKLGMLCPMDRDVIGYKKCVLISRENFKQFRNKIVSRNHICTAIDMVIVTLSIPKSAKCIQPIRLDIPVPSTKIRTNRAKVLAINSLGGRPIEVKDDEICVSPRAFYTKGNKYKEYKVGHWVFANDLDTNIEAECSTGIAFFMNKLNAEVYDPFY